MLSLFAHRPRWAAFIENSKASYIRKSSVLLDLDQTVLEISTTFSGNTMKRFLIMIGLSATLILVARAIAPTFLVETDAVSSTSTNALRRQNDATLPLHPVRDFEDNKDTVLALRHEVLALRTQQAATIRRLEKIEQQTYLRSDAILETSDETWAMETLDEHEAQQEYQRQQDERLAAFDATLLQESVDAVWTVDVSDLVESVLRKSEFGDTYAYDMECRSTLCRLEVRHDNPDAASTFARSFPGSVAAMFSKIAIGHTEDTNGANSMILYLVRKK